jgi:hypothetical protein
VDQMLSRGAFQVVSMLGSLLTKAQSQQLFALNAAGPTPGDEGLTATDLPP